MNDAVDKKFFSAVKTGNRELINKAFCDVYDTYAKLVAFVVGKYVDDKETVKEIVNDTFISLFNHADKISSNIKYYLVVSAKHNAANYLAKKRFKTVALTPEIRDERQYYGYSEVLDSMRRVLTEEQVEIILLHVVEGYALKEIARMKNMNVYTVITVYNRAIKKYRKEVDENA